MPTLFRSLLASATLLLALPAAAQPAAGGVVARVVDAATGEPLPQATVALYAGADSAFVTGGAASVDGVVRIEAVPPGAYAARVSYIGYVTQRIGDVRVQAGAPTDLGEVRLAESTAALGEAEVSAQREFVEQQADRTVYNVQEQAVTAGGSAIETLQTLPSLEVDTDGNISLRGNQNVVIQINGRPTPVRGAFLAALLRQIPADKVARVEVIPNPSAKYEPDGMGGIVNIVLAEGTDRGLSGGLTLGGGTQPNGNVGANLSYQRGKWDLNSQYGFRYDEQAGFSESLINNLILDRLSDQTGETGRQNLSHFLNGSATYSLAEGTTLSAEGSVGYRDGLNNGFTDYLVTFPDDTQLATARRTSTDGENVNGDLALIFRRQFAAGGGGSAGAAGGGPGGGRGMGFGGPRGGGGTQGGHELAIETRYTRNAGDDIGLYDDLIAGDITDRQRQTTDQTTDEASFQVDYTRPIGAGKLEIGGKGTVQDIANDQRYERDQDGQFVNVVGRTNAFEYDSQILAGYLQGARPIGPVQVQAGVRAELASRSFDLLTEVPSLPGIPPVTDTDADQTYFSLFPSVFATLPFGPGSLVKGAYSRRINRPPTFFLNPFPSFEDTTLIRVGNPTLDPEYTDSYELTLQYKYFATLTPYYRRTTDVISRIVTADPTTGARVFTALNLDTESSYGADLTLAGQFLGGNLRGFLSGSIGRQVQTDADPELATDGLVWNARANAQVKLREGTEVQGFMFYRGPEEIVGGRREGFVFSSIGVNQKISDNLQLAARVNDPFGLARFEFQTANDFTITSTRFQPSIQQISATLTYTFGSNQRRPQQPQQPQGGMDDGFGI